MPVVAVVNRKGGSGKSTLATHLAAYLAGRGTPVMLGDVDRQQSTVPWLRRRAARVTAGAPIVSWVIDPRNTLRPPAGVAHVVLDTPAALQGLELQRLLNYADAVLVPLTDSPFDREAAAACIAEVHAHPRVAAGRVRLGVVGMRIDSRTRGAQALQDWAGALGVPLVTTLRAAQVYVRGAEQGLTLFDLPPDRTEADRAQWEPLVEWLRPVLDPPRTTAEPRVPRAPTSTSGTSRRPLQAGPPGAGDDVDVLTAPVVVRVVPTAATAAPRAVAPFAVQPASDIRRVQPAAASPALLAAAAEAAPAASGWRRMLAWLNPRPARPLRGPGP
jgi:chromosome partitioning protein